MAIRTTRQANLAGIAGAYDPLASAQYAFSPPELPPDIVTFAEGPEYLARPRLYPAQRAILRLIFLETELLDPWQQDLVGRWIEGFYAGPDRVGIAPDVFERIAWLKDHGYDHFREIIFVGGRRGGKGHIGAIIGARQMYRLVLMGNPQRYLGIDPDKELVALVTATNFLQARDNQFSDLYFAVTKAPCFRPYLASARGHVLTLRTAADVSKIMTMEAQGVATNREIASIQARAITSNAKAGRGVASFLQIYDEFAHFQVGTAGPRTGEEVYQALTPSLDQVGKEALIYIPTSPYTKVGPAYEIYEAGLEVDSGLAVNPDVLVIQLPSWAPYEGWDDPLATDDRPFISAPQVYGDLLRRIEKRNPDKFRVERRSQWAEVLDAYLPPAFIDRLFEKFGSRELMPQHQGSQQWSYRMHVDPSKSQHNFCMAIGHTEPVEDESGEVWHHVIIDYMHAWKPEDYEDHIIPYNEIEEELARIALRFPTLRVLSYDQYGAFATVSRMKARLRKAGHRTRVVEKTWTVKDQQERWERFKSALGMGWVHSYRDAFFPDGTSLLENELRFLQLRNGKVAKQDIGPVRTDDLADAMSLVTSELLADQLDRLNRRENLAQARLMTGPSGTSGFPGVDESSLALSSARANLQRQSRTQIREAYRRKGGFP